MTRYGSCEAGHRLRQSAEIHGHAVKDLAALNKVEMLRRDERGRMTAAGGRRRIYLAVMAALLAAGLAACRSVKPRRLALIEPQDARLLTLIQLQTDEQINVDAAQGMLTAAGARSNVARVRQAIADFRAAQGLRVLTGVNHLLHPPGNPENDQVLAPAAVAALGDWAQPYAS